MPCLSTLSHAALAFPGDVAGLLLSVAAWPAPVGVAGNGGESDRFRRGHAPAAPGDSLAAGYLAALRAPSPIARNARLPRGAGPGPARPVAARMTGVVLGKDPRAAGHRQRMPGDLGQPATILTRDHEPGACDINRSHRAILAFGAGVHACPGKALTPHVPNRSHAGAHRFAASSPGARIRQPEARTHVRTGRNPGDHPKGITMHATEINDRAAKVAFGYAMRDKSSDELATKENNRWQISHSPPGVAAGDVRARDMSASQV
jgi:hypothetical protein